MRNGRVEQNAPPARIYERPATIFAARFVGTPPMNVVPAVALGESAAWAFAGTPAGIARGDLALGIRPEAVRLAPEGVIAEVVAVEYLGAAVLGGIGRAVEVATAGRAFFPLVGALSYRLYK